MSLSRDEIIVLRWLKTSGKGPSGLSIFTHNAVMIGLREKGMVKHVRRAGFVLNEITRKGRKALKDQERPN